MLPPKGYPETFHYEKKVKDGLYPIEVIDIYLLQNYTAFFQEPCNGCFGATPPIEDDQSEILIENDFIHVPDGGSSFTDTDHFNGKACTYPRATEEFSNSGHVERNLRVLIGVQAVVAVRVDEAERVPVLLEIEVDSLDARLVAREIDAGDAADDHDRGQQNTDG